MSKIFLGQTTMREDTRGRLHRVDWPDPASIIIGGRERTYKTPDGEFPSVTTILRVLGLAKEGLIAWSAREERKAVLEAAGMVYDEGFRPDNGTVFMHAVETRIGPAKQHQKQIQKAAEIGSEIHQSIQCYLTDGSLPVASREEVMRGFLKFHSWWSTSGLKVVRTEQPVWDSPLGYAGTIDLVAEDSAGRLGVVDFKTGKAVYDEAHLQVAAYVHAGSSFAPLEWAQIVRLPKSVEDPEAEAKPLGEMYQRTMTREQLMQAFTGALQVYKVMVAKSG